MDLKELQQMAELWQLQANRYERSHGDMECGKWLAFEECASELFEWLQKQDTKDLLGSTNENITEKQT